jgi:hypothetical protein
LRRGLFSAVPAGLGRPSKSNPGLASWAKFSRPCGTEFGNGVHTHPRKGWVHRQAVERWRCDTTLFVCSLGAQPRDLQFPSTGNNSEGEPQLSPLSSGSKRPVPPAPAGRGAGCGSGVLLARRGELDIVQIRIKSPSPSQRAPAVLLSSDYDESLLSTVTDVCLA